MGSSSSRFQNDEPFPYVYSQGGHLYSTKSQRRAQKHLRHNTIAGPPGQLYQLMPQNMMHEAYYSNQANLYPSRRHRRSRSENYPPERQFVPPLPRVAPLQRLTSQRSVHGGERDDTFSREPEDIRINVQSPTPPPELAALPPTSPASRTVEQAVVNQIPQASPAPMPSVSYDPVPEPLERARSLQLRREFVPSIGVPPPEFDPLYKPRYHNPLPPPPMDVYQFPEFWPLAASIPRRTLTQPSHAGMRPHPFPYPAEAEARGMQALPVFNQPHPETTPERDPVTNQIVLRNQPRSGERKKRRGFLGSLLRGRRRDEEDERDRIDGNAVIYPFRRHARDRQPNAMQVPEGSRNGPLPRAGSISDVAVGASNHIPAVQRSPTLHRQPVEQELRFDQPVQQPTVDPRRFRSTHGTPYPRSLPLDSPGLSAASRADIDAREADFSRETSRDPRAVPPIQPFVRGPITTPMGSPSTGGVRNTNVPISPSNYPPHRIPVVFDRETSPFSNKSEHAVTYMGEMYPTAGHLFEALKFVSTRPDLAERIRSLAVDIPPEDLETFSHNLEAEAGALRPDWEPLGAMEEVLYHKFTQHPDLRNALLQTGAAELVYHTHKDSFWGDGLGARGQNWLGQVLQNVRSRLWEPTSQE